MQRLTEKMAKGNFWWFLWHSGFLALASSFMDVDTVMPSVVADSGGSPLHIGLLVSIMIGGSSVTQLFFASYLYRKRYKKNFLLIGINLRVISLIGLAVFFFVLRNILGSGEVWFILALVSVFSLSGAFANISYIDIMGKSIYKKQRKSFLSLKQVVYSIGILVSALTAFWVLSGSSGSLGYGVLFILAAIFLFIASLGFWKLKEIKGVALPVKSAFAFIRLVIKEIREKPKLRNYIFIISTLGNVLGLMSFMVLYAKMNFPSQDLQVGTMLLVKVFGAVMTGSLLFYFSKRFKYGKLLYIVILLALLLPVLVILFSDDHILFMSTFFVGGILVTMYIVSMSGILLEISTRKNRALYAGAAGAGSIFPAVFSLAGGWIVHSFGFDVFFIIFGLLVAVSVVFIYRIKCRK